MQILKRDLSSIDVTLSSQYSPDLAEGLMSGRLDMAFLRRETDAPDLDYKLISHEPLIVILPSDHRLAARRLIDAYDLVDEIFIGVSNTAPTVKVVIENFFRDSGLKITPQHEGDNLGMFMSLVASTCGVAILPAYTKNFLPWSLTSRPLSGKAPTIDLVLGYNRKNTSPVLQLFLSRVGELIENVETRAASGQNPHSS